jgi:hypothetical protein
MATLHEIKTHPVYVEGCFGCKAASLRIGYCGKAGQDASAQKRWDAELDLFKSATANGVIPDSTKTRDIQRALDWSEKTGKAYTEETKVEHDKTRILERFAV